MQNEEADKKQSVGAMKKRRETMVDGKRYIVYYTFEKAEDASVKSIEKEVKENV